MLKARNYSVVNNQCETSSLTPLPYATQVNRKDRETETSV